MFIKVKYRLDKKLLQRILKLKDVVAPQGAITYADNQSKSENRDEAFRKTAIRWLNYEEYPWVHEAMIRVVSEHQGLFRIGGSLRIERGVQLATYHAGDHYGWHTDGRPTDKTRRVLSISVLLTGNFEGGRLEFKSPGAPSLKKPGDIVLFNSRELHCVTPVTKGVRDSLVVWFTLP